MRFVGVFAHLAPGPALAQQIPALVELHSDVIQASPILVAQLPASIPLQSMLFRNEAIYVRNELGVVHNEGLPHIGSALKGSRSDIRHPVVGRVQRGSRRASVYFFAEDIEENEC